VSGKRIRKPLGLRDWQRAQERARQWEAEGFVDAGKIQTVREACDRFTADCNARGLRDSTMKKYRLLFRQLEEFAASEGMVFISDLDIDAVRDFRATWPNKNIAARKKLEHLKAFFKFASESGWCKTNPAEKIKPPATHEPQIVPFTPSEFQKILKACNKYADKQKANKLRALVLLMRYTGLRISDAVCLARNAIQRNRLRLHTAKNGIEVSLPLPEAVSKALNALPYGPYYFWSGESKLSSATGNWQKHLQKLFRLAEVPRGYSHLFRHTLATELLVDGTPIETVATVLGHGNVKVTLKHYSHWIKGRQEKLDADLRRTWARLGHARK